MADVRALLRSERVVRRISHPQAQYSSSGALSCRVCLLPIKAESLWELHVQSKQHKINGQKQTNYQANGSDAVADMGAKASSSRKRKASIETQEERELPKAQKVAQLPSQASSNIRTASDGEPQKDKEEMKRDPQAEERSDLEATTTSQNGQSRSRPNGDTINEEEWKAFEREVASLPMQQGYVKAVSSAATIEASPLSAEEIAAQAREEQSRQREMREAEMEEEKEDATRKLENELDEMEELELRVRRLREKREAIRHAKDESATRPDISSTTQQQIDEDELQDEIGLKSTENGMIEISSENSEEGEWDAWRLW